MEGFLRYQFGGLIFGILRYKNDFQQKHGTRHIATWKLYAINYLP